MYCDTLYINGLIYTMDTAVKKAGWVAEKNGIITALGMGKPSYMEAAKVIDLEGRVLLPGFIDSHMHGTPTGAFLNDVNVNQASCINEVLELIKGACEKSNEEWVFGSGLSIVSLKEGRAPSRWELDGVSGEHPVLIKNVTLHGCVVNSKAFEIVQVPEGTSGIVMNENKIPTGEFTSDDSAFYASNHANLNQSDRVLLKYITDCVNHCASKGVTTLSALDGGLFDATDRDFFMWLNLQERIPIHVVNFFQNENVHLGRALKLPRIGGCLCLDGAGFEGTMATREPYNDGKYPAGILYWTDERLYKFLSEANRAGMQTAIHALGDRAVDQYLRVYERVFDELGLDGNPFHNRIEHFSLVWPEQVDKAVKMGLILSMQPRFAYQWDDKATELGKSYEVMLGRERADRMEPLSEIIAKGGIIAGGSDSPVTIVDPLFGIHAACNMPNKIRRVNVHEALKMFTINGAIANRQESEKGSVTVGKLADFVVIDRDPYQEPEHIKDFTVVMTIVKGKVVYTNEDGMISW